MKAAVIDLETTSLSAVGSGMLVCGAIKSLDMKIPKVLRYDRLSCRPGHEKRLVEELMAEVSKYHLLIGHNVTGFDWPFLKSRAIRLGVPLIKPPLAYDTLAVWRRLGLRTSLGYNGKPVGSLDHIVDFFGIPQLKTKLYPVEHWKSVWETGEARQEAVDEIVDHCIRDVRNTEEVYWRLLEIDTGNGVVRLK